MQKCDLRRPLDFMVQQFRPDGVEEIVHIVFRTELEQTAAETAGGVVEPMLQLRG